SELRWKDLRRELASQGAPPSIMEGIEPFVPDAHLDGACLAVVANLADGILHVEHGPEAPSTDVAAWAPLPRLVPLLRWRQTLLPHMIVLVDRTGADLIGVARDRADVVRTAEGQDDEIRKSAPGGWSQRRYQQRAAAQVEVLLVDDRPEDDRTAWFGPEPAHVAADPSTLQVVGVDRPQEARLVDAALRAALGTGAAILVTPPVGGPAEGMGAILRWGPPPPG